MLHEKPWERGLELANEERKEIRDFESHDPVQMNLSGPRLRTGPGLGKGQSLVTEEITERKGLTWKLGRETGQMERKVKKGRFKKHCRHYGGRIVGAKKNLRDH